MQRAWLGVGGRPSLVAWLHLTPFQRSDEIWAGALLPLRGVITRLTDGFLWRVGC